MSTATKATEQTFSNKMSLSDKAKMILTEAAKQYGAAEVDLLKLTPKGQDIAAAAQRVARKLYETTKDKDWLRAGRQIVGGMGSKQKPATANIDLK